jgi:hypothetical protein
MGQAPLLADDPVCHSGGNGGEGLFSEFNRVDQSSGNRAYPSTPLPALRVAGTLIFMANGDAMWFHAVGCDQVWSRRLTLNLE